MKPFLPSGLLLILVILSFNSFTQDTKIFQSDKLTKKWETKPVFQIPESVCFDAERNVLYVSNINGKLTDMDGNGYISKCSLTVEILEQKCITGLDAPKGMGVYKNLLYVSDIDRVAEIDIISGKINRFFETADAKFLNDIAIDDQGNVYISDMNSNKIYRISGGKISVWLDDALTPNPNGLFVDVKNLLIGCGKIVKTDLVSRKPAVMIDNTGSIDGLEGTGDGRYLFSDWKGNVYLTSTGLSIEKILNLTPAGMNAADIEYIPSKKLLLVPTFSDNRMIAFELKY